jgi:hypothetical protein
MSAQNIIDLLPTLPELLLPAAQAQDNISNDYLQAISKRDREKCQAMSSGGKVWQQNDTGIM